MTLAFVVRDFVRVWHETDMPGRFDDVRDWGKAEVAFQGRQDRS
jgi:hypothetical protein